MSASTGDGGPAFPMPSGPENVYEHGMTLRDYFAAAALTGLLACEGTNGEAAVHRDEAYVFAMFARAAYRYADAMLAAGARSPS